MEPLLGDLIDAGLDAINPVQITCRGMAPEHLKQAYGDRLAFWGGGCDTRRVLAHGTPAEVRDNVRRLVGVFAPGGGFVFQQAHNILADVPPENVAAMFDAVGGLRRPMRRSIPSQSARVRCNHERAVFGRGNRNKPGAARGTRGDC